LLALSLAIFVFACVQVCNKNSAMIDESDQTYEGCFLACQTLGFAASFSMR